ncbi:MAG TPA: hypothetical protein G4O15_02610 [Dehalococcoidia bacterium]|nr:hypothetical protein [Dehalococcoidia bacterium]
MGKTIIEVTPKFTENTVGNLEKLIPVYNADEDVLCIKPKESVPAVSYDWGGEIWIRFEPESKEVVGIEIENFESVFIKKHPEVAKVWKAAKPFCNQKKTRVKEDSICESFIKILLSFLDEFLKNNPQQTSFSIG